MTPVEALAIFLDALDQWECEDNAERARSILDFIRSGYDLSEWDESRPRFTIINGGRERGE